MLNVIQAQSLHEKPLPRKSNLVNYSLFKTLDSWIDFRSFSIKYVAEGHERYFVNDNIYDVHAGQYILANDHATGKVEINSKTWVKGICIDVAPALISEALASRLRPDTLQPDANLDKFFTSPDYLDNLYHVADNKVGALLKSLESELTSEKNTIHTIRPDVYFDFATAIVEDHIPVYQALQRIPSVKMQTAKDLFRRVNKARLYIENLVHSPVNIDELAADVFMSPYHFHRTFKSAFNTSPYHYSLMVRLNYARKLIQENQLTWTEAASATGFSDISAFGKSYKKYLSVLQARG